MASLQMRYNLRLNKKKSEILTAEKEEEIGGIRCTKMVKYLGVKINADVKLQRKTAKEHLPQPQHAEVEAKGGRTGCGLTTYLLLSPLASHIYWHSHVCSRTLEKEGH